MLKKSLAFICKKNKMIFLYQRVQVVIINFMTEYSGNMIKTITKKIITRVYQHGTINPVFIDSIIYFCKRFISICLNKTILYKVFNSPANTG